MQTPEHITFAASAGVDIPDEPWADIERALDLIARRATYGNARTDAAAAALRLFGDALEIAKTNAPEHVREFIDGYDVDTTGEAA